MLSETPEQTHLRLTEENYERWGVITDGDRCLRDLPRDENGVPNPYDIATRQVPIVTTNGVPDPYATALARREVQ
jgi:hypothetical protein